MDKKWSMATKAGVVMGVVAALTAVSMLAPAAPTPLIAAGFTPTDKPTDRPTDQPTERPTDRPDRPDDCLVAIRGRVTDLCTGEPARSVPVSINGVIVNTDGQGDYSLTGLQPGEYVVTVLVDAAWQPSSQTVYLPDCGQVGMVDLTFDTCLAPGPAPTEVPVMLPETGAALPAAAVPGVPALAGFGLAIVGLAIGLVLAVRPKR